MELTQPTRLRALTATEVVTQLAKLDGWRLSGDGAQVAIEKAWDFENFYQAMSFTNAVAHLANQYDHHPELQVTYRRCVVRFHTHAVSGLSVLDFESAVRVDALQKLD